MKINHITQSVSEAANSAQQAAIAVNMKRAHKKPKAVSEVSDKTLTSYQKKVSADFMKNNMNPTKRSPEKRNRSVAGVAKAHNRLEKRLGEGSISDLINQDPTSPKFNDHPGPSKLKNTKTYTPTAGELARDFIKTPDDVFKTKYGMSKRQAEQHYSSSNLKESRRDQDDKILRLFTSGKSPKAIAAQLSIDVDTVNDYINNRMPDSQDNSPRGYSSNRNVGQGMNEQFDPGTTILWIDQVSQLAQAVSQLSPEELVKLNDAFQSFFRVAGGATAGAASVGIGAMFYSLLKDTLYAAKSKAKVDTEEILQLKRQIISIHKTLKKVKTDKAIAKYQAMLKQAFDVLAELEARHDNGVAEGLRGTGNPGMPTPYDQGRADAKKGRPYDNPYNQSGEEQEHRNYRKGYDQSKHQGVEEGKTGPGLWANIHAKQNRIKSGSGEHMRKPGSKGAPKSSDFKAAASESSNYGDLDESHEPYDYKVGQRAAYTPLKGNYPPFPVVVTSIEDEYIEFRSESGQPIPGTNGATEWGADPGWKVLTPVQGVAKESSNYGDLDEAFNLEEEINKLNEKSAAWQKKSGKSKSGGLNQKGVNSYRREHPGSKLQTAVTTKPSKLKPGSKPANRRKSFCARMSGVKGPMKKPNGKPTRKALALRKWNC
jgi:DNA-binding CsgD family transcriptional regulator